MRYSRLAMVITANMIVVGQCFAAAEARPQVLRVLVVADNSVMYEIRGQKAVKGRWARRTTVSMDRFLASVDRPVSCNYDPDFGG